MRLSRPVSGTLTRRSDFEHGACTPILLDWARRNRRPKTAGWIADASGAAHGCRRRHSGAQYCSATRPRRFAASRDAHCGSALRQISISGDGDAHFPLAGRRGGLMLAARMPPRGTAVVFSDSYSDMGLACRPSRCRGSMCLRRRMT